MAKILTKNQTYEQMESRLEEIIEQIDSGKLSLEELTGLHQEATELIKQMQLKLQKAG